MGPRFEIYGTDLRGKEFLCFIWCRDAQSGIARAYIDSKRFKRPLKSARAVPLEAEC